MFLQTNTSYKVSEKAVSREINRKSTWYQGQKPTATHNTYNMENINSVILPSPNPERKRETSPFMNHHRKIEILCNFLAHQFKLLCSAKQRIFIKLCHQRIPIPRKREMSIASQIRNNAWHSRLTTPSILSVQFPRACSSLISSKGRAIFS